MMELPERFPGVWNFELDPRDEFDPSRRLILRTFGEGGALSFAECPPLVCSDPGRSTLIDPFAKGATVDSGEDVVVSPLEDVPLSSIEL